MISPMHPIKCDLIYYGPRSPIIQRSVPLALPVLKVIIFSPLDQQLLLRLDHATEIMCHLFRRVQFDFEEGNL